jgi:histone deacetylase 11
MSLKYQFGLNYSTYICKCLEVPLFFLPEFTMRMRVLEPMQLALKGSIDAACLALKHGWAINLAGGYHHAHCQGGGGFCIYPDITFIVHYIRKWHGIKRVMIVDLDAHQGNGHETDFLNDDEVCIVDAYNPYIYPGDEEAARAIKHTIHVKPKDNDNTYLQKLRNGIEPAI